MKLIITLLLFLSSFADLGAQSNIIRNSYRNSRYTFKFPDSLNLKTISKAKIDTIYFRNLEPEKEKKDEWWKTLIPLIVAISGGLLTILGQYLIKKIERKGTRENLRNQKKIDHLEQISIKINKLSLISPQNDLLIISELNGLQNYVFENNLYVDENYEKLIQEVNDYYTSVAQNPLLKKVETETKLRKQFKSYFNR